MVPGPGSFPTTRWSLVARSRSTEDAARRDSVEALARAYWQPVYVYIRMAWSKTSEDAKDLTQEFLIRLVDGSLAERADPSLGSFRGYLKGALRHFLMDAAKTDGRLKRGGGRTVLALDTGASLPEPAAGDTPDRAFDRAWGRELLDAAARELEASLRAEGREICWRVFERHDFRPGDSASTSYREVADALGLPESDVKAHLAYARLRMRRLLRDRAADTVGSEEALLSELKELFEE